MKTAKKVIACAVALVLLLSVTSCSQGSPSTSGNTPGSTSATDVPSTFPTDTVYGFVPFGAGGSTDLISRAIAAGMGDKLGTSIVVDNMTGGSGAVAAEYVANSNPDGYTIYYHCESTCLYQPLELADVDLQDFELLMIYGSGYGVMCVSSASPYKSAKELLEYAASNPGKLKIGGNGATGTGTLYAYMCNMAYGVDDMFTIVQYDGDGDGMVALMSGEIDVFIPSQVAPISYVESGDVVPLAIFNDVPVSIDVYSDVPLAADVNPEFAKYLPYASYFGCSVAAGTPEDIVNTLAEAAEYASNTDGVQEVMNNNGFQELKLFGDEADAYTEKIKTVAWVLLYGAGVVDSNPADYGYTLD